MDWLKAWNSFHLVIGSSRPQRQLLRVLWWMPIVERRSHSYRQGISRSSTSHRNSCYIESIRQTIQTHLDAGQAQEPGLLGLQPFVHLVGVVTVDIRFLH